MTDPQRKQGKRISRRAFLAGAAAGGAGVWAVGVMPRWMFAKDPHRPPSSTSTSWTTTGSSRRTCTTIGSTRRSRGASASTSPSSAGALRACRQPTTWRVAFPGSASCSSKGRVAATGRVGATAASRTWASRVSATSTETQGPEAARAYYDATRLGLEQIRTFADEYGVDCELELTGSTMLAAEESHLESAHRGEGALRPDGDPQRPDGPGRAASQGQLRPVLRRLARPEPRHRESGEAGARDEGCDRDAGRRGVRAFQGDADGSGVDGASGDRVRGGAREQGGDRTQRLRAADRSVQASHPAR